MANRLKKNNPGCNCCESADPCANCSGGTPDTITVTLSGYDNAGACSDCAEKLDGEWVCTQSPANPCLWSVAYNDHVCTNKDFIIEAQLIDAGGGEYRWRVTVTLVLGLSSDVHRWQGMAAATINCTGNEVLSAVSATGFFCDASSVTCEIN